VEAAVAGTDTVFHVAAVYRDWAPDPTSMYDVNIRGTFHVLEAARRARVERVVYTASMVSIGRPEPGSLGDEQTAYEGWDLDFPYSRSKYFSRELAETFGQWDQDVRIVCPGLILGPGDIRPTPSGRLIINSFLEGPAVHFSGGASYVDVRDAAAAHLLAAERGKPGERYLATAHNLTNHDFVSAIDRATGRRRRQLRLPTGVARTIIRTMEHRARRTGRPPLLTRHFFEYCQKPSFYSNAKAVRELGATFRPMEDTLRDAIAYFRERGMIPDAH